MTPLTKQTISRRSDVLQTSGMDHCVATLLPFYHLTTTPQIASVTWPTQMSKGKEPSRILEIPTEYYGDLTNVNRKLTSVDLDSLHLMGIQLNHSQSSV